MKLLLVSICLAFALVGGHQDFGCSFDDNLLISNVTSTRGHNHGNSLTDWGSRRAVVPYFFAKGIPEAEKAVVRKEMQRIRKHVPCIKFNEKSERDVPKHHLEIRIGNGQGCYGSYPWSYGMRFRGSVTTNPHWYGSKVVLDSAFRLANTAWCAKQAMIQGGVLHELMHALGIAHTQKRADRDQHITYNNHCVCCGKHSQYEKTRRGELKDYGVPYKCNSIMHYKDDTFAKNNQCKTMIPKSASCKATGIGSNVAIKEDWQLLKKAHCGR